MGLRLRLFVPLAAPALAVAGYFYLGWLPAAIEQERQQYIRAQTTRLETLAEALVEPLLRNDLGQIYATLDGLMARAGDWRDLRLYADNRLLYPLDDAPPPADRPTAIALQQPVANFGGAPAELVLTIDPQDLSGGQRERLAGWQRQLLAGIALYLLLAAGIAEWWVRQRLFARDEEDRSKPVFSITGRIGVLLLVPVLGAMAAVAIFYSYVEETRFDGAFVNVSGRQRLLTQQIEAHARMVHIGQEEDRKPLRELAAAFDEGLTALERGGQVLEYQLPSAPVPAELAALRALWRDQRAAVNTVAARPAGAREAQAAYEQAARNTPALVAAANRVILALEERDGQLRRRMLVTLALIAAIDLVLLFAGIGVVARYAAAQRAAQRRTEADLHALHAAHRRYEGLVNAIEGIVWEMDADKRFTFVSAKAERLLGHPVQRWIEEPAFWQEHIHPDDLPGALAVLATAGADGTGHDLEYRMRASDGRWVWLHSIVSAASAGGGAVCLRGVMVDVSARMEMDAALRANEHRLAVLLDNTVDGIVTIDERGFIQSFNKAAERMFGYGVSEVLGSNVSVLMPPPHAAAHDSYMRRYRQTGETRILGKLREVEAQRRDGTLFPIELAVNEVAVDGGRIYTAVLRDVSERKRHERRLRELVTITSTHGGGLDDKVQALLEFGCRQLRLDTAMLLRAAGERLAVTHVHDASGCFQRGQDFDLRATYCGVAFRQQEMVAIEHAAAQGWAAYPAYAACRLETYLGVPVNVNGEPHGVLNFSAAAPRTRAFVDSDKELIKLMAQWIGMELERHAAAERLNLALDGASAGLWDWNAGSGELYLSARCQTMLGYSPGELDGRRHSWMGLVHPDDIDRIMQALLAHLDGHAPAYDAEYRMQAKDGAWRWIHARGQSVERDAAGQALRLVGVQTDITARVVMEAELRQTRDAALDAMRVKGEFLANMSHEIRTPMNGVLGMLELVRDTTLAADQREYIDTAYKSGQGLLSLINDTLDFSKIEAGRMQVERVPFDLREVVEGAMETVALRAYGKGLELGCLVDLTLAGGVTGDPTRVRQVLLNLLGNAVKFTERGEIFVSVSRIDADAGGITVRIEVSDTGCGIAPAAQAHIFEPFVQADGSTTRRFGGTGLGLAICKRLVELMGGEMGVLSEAERGSIFWFTLRLGAGEPAAAFTPDPRLAERRALIAGDNTLQRMALQQLLASFGMQHALAVNADEALTQLDAARAAGRPFEVVLFDTCYPQREGREFIRRLAGVPAHDGTHLLLVLPFGHAWAHGELARSGWDASLAKPLRRHQLHDGLLELLVPEAVRAPVSAPLATTRRGRLLVAEDNPVNRQVMIGMLRRLGHEIELVEDGQAALARVKAVQFDLVFMDCQMPVLDGYAATRAIRVHEAACAGGAAPAWRTPVIAMTANAMVGDREKCLEAGMDDYLSKPVSLERLAAMLDRWLGAAQAPAPETGKAPGAELNQQVLDSLREVLGSGFTELLQTYLADAAQHVVSLHEALAAQDRERLRTVAHTLKGSSSNVGASALTAACAELEQCARSGAPPALVDTLRTVETRWHAVQTRLGQLLRPEAA